MTGRAARSVHDATTYRYGCRCGVCRTAERDRRRVQRAGQPKQPCDECKRLHAGPRCKPAGERVERVCLTLPGPLARSLRDRIPWGDRSKWLAELVEKELA